MRSTVAQRQVAVVCREEALHASLNQTIAISAVDDIGEAHEVADFQRLAVEIESTLCYKNLSCFNVLEQLDSLAVLGCFECFVKRRVLHAANLSNIAVRLDAVRAVTVRDRDVAFCAEVCGNNRGIRAARDCDLVGCSEGCFAGFLVRPVVGLDSCVRAVGLEGTFGDRDRAEALVAGTVDDGDGRAVLDCAVVLGEFVTSLGSMWVSTPTNFPKDSKKTVGADASVRQQKIPFLRKYSANS